MKNGLETIVDDGSRILILGSLPGDTSLAAGRYYAHPRNRFWPILSRAYDEPIEADYRSRLLFLRRHRIALWDVLKAAERRGSLDSNIRSPVVNDLAALIRNHGQIRAVGLNGAKAGSYFSRHWGQHSVFSSNDMRICRLPSSSSVPGRHVKSFEEKVQAWREFLNPVT
ncbi:MAG: DNA-deoxyinosine glycosylase [Rhodobacteraceae bacterium]|nr:DNA-deoxyinosine glycosylase [Paracoccaceae bacterium]